VSAVTPATWPRGVASATRLLLVDPAAGFWCDALLDDLERLLRPGDLLVVNDAATLPASLPGTARGSAVEIRLAGAPSHVGGPEIWPAVVFGPGSWRQRTEDRPAPPSLRPGDRVDLGPLGAEVVAVSSVSPRLVSLRFDREGDAFWSRLFGVGRPVQYAYVRDALPLWHVQTPYAGRPLAVEMPSAGRALRLPVLRALRNRGVRLARVTHAAGLSSTGDPAIDAVLPLPERSEVPAATAEEVVRTKAGGGRVVAVGTSVVRALESAWDETNRRLQAGQRTATLRLGPGHAQRVVDGLLTGVHEPGESHFDLLQAFAPRPLLEAALAHARSAGYLGHEFGDSSLVLPGEQTTRPGPSLPPPPS
jgi:S-adenosylmethionine:tRNA ribosyltransferase-isomerase